MHECSFVIDQLWKHGLVCDCAGFGLIFGALFSSIFSLFVSLIFPSLKKFINRIKSKKKPYSQA